MITLKDKNSGIWKQKQIHIKFRLRIPMGLVHLG